MKGWQAFKLLVNKLFVQGFVRANIVLNIKALCYWSFAGTNGLYYGKRFHVMTSSQYFSSFGVIISARIFLRYMSTAFPWMTSNPARKTCSWWESWKSWWSPILRAPTKRGKDSHIGLFCLFFLWNIYWQCMRNAMVKRQTFLWHGCVIHCKIAW